MLSRLFPVPLFARAHLRRAAGLWLGGRLMLALPVLLAAAARGEPMPDVIHVGPDLALYAIVATTVLGLLDTRMRREELFLANLGVSRVRVGATFAAAATLLELGVALTGHR